MDASEVPPHAVMQWLCDPEGLIQRLCPFLTLGLFSPEMPLPEVPEVPEGLCLQAAVRGTRETGQH